MSAKTPDRRARLLQIICVLLGIMGVLAYAISKFSSGKAVVIVTAVGVLGSLGTLIALAIRTKRFRLIVGRIAGTLIAVILGSYLILSALVFFFQDTIANEANAFFQPRGISAAAAQAWVGKDVEALNLTTPDGARLAGWLVKNTFAPRAPLVIFFDGSGSVTSEMIPYVRKLAGWSVALVNYRGFGPSTGTPSHAHALADATLIYDTLAQRPDVDRGQIAAMGYSLGAGIAVYLAEQRPVVGTILVAPYDYQTLIGLKQEPLYAPLAGIMHRYFDAIARAPAIRSPLVCLVGADDQAIAPERSFKLARSWGGETTVKTYAGEDHGLLLHENSSWADIAAFLARLN
jgi:hypothetical protein